MRFNKSRRNVKSKGKKHKHRDRLCLFDLRSHKRGPAGGRSNDNSNGNPNNKGAIGAERIGWSPTAATHQPVGLGHQ
jgi:hypothetical protein